MKSRQTYSVYFTTLVNFRRTQNVILLSLLLALIGTLIDVHSTLQFYLNQTEFKDKAAYNELERSRESDSRKENSVYSDLKKNLTGTLVDVNNTLQFYLNDTEFKDEAIYDAFKRGQESDSRQENSGHSGYKTNLTSDGIKKKSTSDDDATIGSSAFCLILKDDNAILAEWVAYHYHVFNMRRLVVAVDPTSKTTPNEILETFRRNFDLNISIWNDEDYTPLWWRERQPLELQSSLNIVNPHLLKECRKSVTIYDPLPDKKYPAQMDLEPGDYKVERCNHIFRQRMFYSECSLRIQEETAKKEKDAITWTVFTDTDEYLVPNPWMDHYINDENFNDTSVEKYMESGELNFTSHELKAMYPDTPSSGSLWSFFQKFQKGVAAPKSQNCVILPRIQFGSNDGISLMDSTTATITDKDSNNVTTTVWSHKNFDSLRYKYHQNHESRSWPKGMLNLANLPREDLTMKTTRKETSTVYLIDMMKPNMHYPHKSCDWVEVDRKYGVQTYGIQKNNPHWWHQPLAHNHYLGPEERFVSREDLRRTVKNHRVQNRKSNQAIGESNRIRRRKKYQNTTDTKERWWIKGWLDSFVATHGSEKTYAILGEDYATRKILKEEDTKISEMS